MKRTKNEGTACINSLDSITDCYDKVASSYSDKFLDELDHKPMDCILLTAFANRNKRKGTILDIGCGPGQVARYLFRRKITDIIGVDISKEMLAIARIVTPAVCFRQENMLDLTFRDNSIGAAIAFYSIVNFNYAQVALTFAEIYRVLVDEGEFLICFHAGDEIIHLTEFLGKELDVYFYLFDVERIEQMLNETGFWVVYKIIRDPYPEEHPTKRAYFLIRKSLKKSSEQSNERKANTLYRSEP